MKQEKTIEFTYNEDDHVWVTAKGERIPMTQMTDEHMQAALRSAESRYVKHNNQAIRHADTAALLSKKIRSLLSESRRRNLQLQSLSEVNPEKYSILENDRKWFERMEKMESV